MKVTVRGITIEGTAEELRPWLPPVPSAVEATGIPWVDVLGSPACAPWEPGGAPSAVIGDMTADAGADAPAPRTRAIPWPENLRCRECEHLKAIERTPHGRCFCGADRCVSVDYPATAAAAK